MNRDQTEPRRKLTSAVWIATGLGVGLVSPAPGTIGALWGIAWAWGVLSFAYPWGWATVLVGLAAGVPLCDRAQRDLGGKKDPGEIVWDEIATVPLIFLFAGEDVGWFTLLLGFGLHRLFDISKPWPCKRLERLHGGLGIMADDVMAALYGALALRGIFAISHLATS
ncbi:MAG: phosphatidylglycerophosphatase A [Planctomycetales bacterium]|nr:phosphatidylglycerophosphatase A [Planctomycetales bacterium]